LQISAGSQHTRRWIISVGEVAMENEFLPCTGLEALSL